MSQPLYFGNEMDAWIPSGGAAVESTQGGSYDSTYCRCSIACTTVSYISSVTFSSSQSLWSHFDFFPNLSYVQGSREDTIYTINNSSGVNVFKVTVTGVNSFGSNMRMYYLSSLPSTFTQIGNTISFSAGRITVDVNVNITNGTAAIYIGGSLQTSGTASMPAITNFASVTHCGGPNNGNTYYYSQLFGSLSQTVGVRLLTIVEDTNGFHQDFAGAVTDINELVYNDATGITSSTNGNISTYYKNGLSLTGSVVLGVGTSARFNVGATGPQNLQNVLRVSSGDYTSPSTLGAAGFAPAQYMWMTNPATSAAWTPTTAAAVEWGVKAIT